MSFSMKMWYEDLIESWSSAILPVITVFAVSLGIAVEDFKGSRGKCLKSDATMSWYL